MARKMGAVKTFIDLWQNHENIYYSIFYEALTRLEINEKQRKDEDAISEALCPILREVCFEHKEDIKLPAWENPIQPVKGSELKGGKSRNRPDFSCNLVNSLADCSEVYEIPFHIECKRLGKTKGSWNLNRNYVTSGIGRFESESHEYGKRAPSGMMIGYIVSMEPDSILEKVNEHLPALLPQLCFSFTRKNSLCEQALERKNIDPKAFKLLHLWSDLRGTPQSTLISN